MGPALLGEERGGAEERTKEKVEAAISTLYESRRRDWFERVIGGRNRNPNQLSQASRAATRFGAAPSAASRGTAGVQSKTSAE